ncbi:unnamed protein product [Amoebophrya sp. A120]|nr:unnamed protein product [Amoebophrya sp. A120]|eukprot:GSA120T00016391001.1
MIRLYEFDTSSSEAEEIANQAKQKRRAAAGEAYVNKGPTRARGGNHAPSPAKMKKKEDKDNTTTASHKQVVEQEKFAFVMRPKEQFAGQVDVEDAYLEQTIDLEKLQQEFKKAEEQQTKKTKTKSSNKNLPAEANEDDLQLLGSLYDQVHLGDVRNFVAYGFRNQLLNGLWVRQVRKTRPLASSGDSSPHGGASSSTRDVKTTGMNKTTLLSGASPTNNSPRVEQQTAVTTGVKNEKENENGKISNPAATSTTATATTTAIDEEHFLDARKTYYVKVFVKDNKVVDYFEQKLKYSSGNGGGPSGGGIGNSAAGAGVGRTTAGEDLHHLIKDERDFHQSSLMNNLTAQDINVGGAATIAKIQLIAVYDEDFCMRIYACRKMYGKPKKENEDYVKLLDWFHTKFANKSRKSVDHNAGSAAGAADMDIDDAAGTATSTKKKRNSEAEDEEKRRTSLNSLASDEEGDYLHRGGKFEFLFEEKQLVAFLPNKKSPLFAKKMTTMLELFQKEKELLLKELKMVQRRNDTTPAVQGPRVEDDDTAALVKRLENQQKLNFLRQFCFHEHCADGTANLDAAYCFLANKGEFRENDFFENSKLLLSWLSREENGKKSCALFCDRYLANPLASLLDVSYINDEEEGEEEDEEHDQQTSNKGGKNKSSPRKGRESRGDPAKDDPRPRGDSRGGGKSARNRDSRAGASRDVDAAGARGGDSKNENKLGTAGFLLADQKNKAKKFMEILPVSEYDAAYVKEMDSLCKQKTDKTWELREVFARQQDETESDIPEEDEITDEDLRRSSKLADDNHAPAAAPLAARGAVQGLVTPTAAMNKV